jgi:hypothetical protein
VDKSSFCRGRAAYDQHNEVGLIKEKPIPKSPANHTRPEIIEKVLSLSSKYYFGSMRAV